MKLKQDKELIKMLNTINDDQDWGTILGAIDRYLKEGGFEIYPVKQPSKVADDTAREKRQKVIDSIDKFKVNDKVVVTGIDQPRIGQHGRVCEVAPLSCRILFSDGKKEIILNTELEHKRRPFRYNYPEDCLAHYQRENQKETELKEEVRPNNLRERDFVSVCDELSPYFKREGVIKEIIEAEICKVELYGGEMKSFHHADLKPSSLSQYVVNSPIPMHNGQIDWLAVATDGRETMATYKATYTPFQKCPVCEGKGKVPSQRGFNEYSIRDCHCCQGAGVIPMKSAL